MSCIMKAENIYKSFSNAGPVQEVLRGVSIEIEKGSFACIMGSSGSGKSTLLYILSTLEKADSGEIYYLGKKLPKVDSKNDKELSRLRRDNFSFIFQFYNLMPALTVEENLYLPILLNNENPDIYKEKIGTVLKLVEMEDKRNKKVGRLSGGEQQRVSIVRAVISNTNIIFADEPTGNLDNNNSKIIVSLLKNLAQSYGKTIIMVTHDVEISKEADMVYFLKNGEIKASKFV